MCVCLSIYIIYININVLRGGRLAGGSRRFVHYYEALCIITMSLLSLLRLAASPCC